MPKKSKGKKKVVKTKKTSRKTTSKKPLKVKKTANHSISVKKTVKKSIKRPIKAKRATKSSEPLAITQEILELKELMQDILHNQKKLLEKEDSVFQEEKQIEKEEAIVRQEEASLLKEEKQQLPELEELEKIEHEIQKEVKRKPLSRITSRDFYKAIIGAFFGIVGHFSFFYGTEIAHGDTFTMTRAISLYIVSFVLAILFMYFAGFRKVDKNIWRYLPWRVLVIYSTSILVIIFVLYLFGFISGNFHFEELFKTVSTISILAVLGASTADLIGRGEE